MGWPWLLLPLSWLVWPEPGSRCCDWGLNRVSHPGKSWMSPAKDTSPILRAVSQLIIQGFPLQGLMSTESEASQLSTFWARGSECKDWRMCSHMGKIVSGFRLTVAFSSSDSALYHSEQGSVTAGPCGELAAHSVTLT